MKVVGLTGGIATGKSTVSAVLEQERVPVIDCDKIAHAVVRKGRWGHRRVVREFGEEILRPDGELNRAKLGALIFPDPTARRRLNRATHLPVFAEVARQLLVCWLRFCPAVVVDMPLLFETRSHRFASATILVVCDEEVQVARLVQRDGCSEEQARAKVAAQMPLAEKRRMAGTVIDNNSSQEALQAQAREAARRIRRHSGLHRLLLGPGAAAALLAGLARLLLGLGR